MSSIAARSATVAGRMSMRPSYVPQVSPGFRRRFAGGSTERGFAAGAPLEIGRVELRELLGESVGAGAQLVGRVARGGEKAQPRQVLLDGGVENGLHVDAAAMERPGELQAIPRAPDDGRDDRRPLAHPGVDAALAAELEEETRPLLQGVHDLGVDLELPQRRQ